MKQEFYNLQLILMVRNYMSLQIKQLNGLINTILINGILNLSIQHTSASLIVQENADPDVQTDLINYFDKLAPMDNKLIYSHH